MYIYLIVGTCSDLIRPSSGDLYEYKTHDALYTVCTNIQYVQIPVCALCQWPENDRIRSKLVATIKHIIYINCV